MPGPLRLGALGVACRPGVLEGLLAPLLSELRPPESVLCLAGAFRGIRCTCLPSGGLWPSGFS